MKTVKQISADAAVLDWLKRLIKGKWTEEPSAAELYFGLDELVSGETDCLQLTCADQEEGPGRQPHLSCGDLVIYPHSRRVLRGNTECALTPKEFDILYFLAQNRGIVFTKEQIYQAVWKEEFYTADSNIMAFIRKLRKKIEPEPDAPQYILTVWGIGYTFNDRL